MRKGSRTSFFQIILLATIVKYKKITMKNICDIYDKKAYTTIVDLIDRLVKTELIRYEHENDLVFYVATEEGISSLQLIDDAIKSVK